MNRYFKKPRFTLKQFFTRLLLKLCRTDRGEEAAKHDIPLKPALAIFTFHIDFASPVLPSSDLHTPKRRQSPHLADLFAL
jgi:hypothetical protein